MGSYAAVASWGLAVEAKTPSNSQNVSSWTFVATSHGLPWLRCGSYEIPSTIYCSRTSWCQTHIFVATSPTEDILDMMTASTEVLTGGANAGESGTGTLEEDMVIIVLATGI